jgi:hypothetical protein
MKIFQLRAISHDFIEISCDKVSGFWGVGLREQFFALVLIW